MLNTSSGSYAFPSSAEMKLARGSSAVDGGSRLSKAASEFESVLLGQWLGSAESSFGSVPGSEEDGDAGGEQMRGFATQQLAQAFTAAGGVGIADMVQKAFEKASLKSR